MARRSILGARKSSKFSTIPPEIHEFCNKLLLTGDQLFEITQIFSDQINRGLNKKSHKTGEMKCDVTYVQDLPNGKEQGRYLALNVTHTGCRVIVILLEEKSFDMQCKKFPISTQIRNGTANEFFDYIVECLENFIDQYSLTRYLPLPLGLMFSFPIHQEDLDKAILLRWTSTFNVKGVVGNDVVTFLKEALTRKGIDVKVCAVLNVATGTLLAAAWKNHDCRVGLIVGIGVCICYVEEVEQVEVFRGDKTKKYVIINVDSGELGENGELNFIRTEEDLFLDENSINPGRQLFEKMVSDLYLGELVRIVMVKLIDSKLILKGKGSDEIKQRGNFYTEYMLKMESDEEDEVETCKKIMNDLGLKHATVTDCIALRYICKCFFRRSSALVGAIVAALINKMNFKVVSVACDGSLYRDNPYYHYLLAEHITSLVKRPVQFNLMSTEDLYGFGAGLLAAMVSRQKKS